MCKKLQRIKALPALLILALMFALCITAYGTDADEPAAAAEAAVQITKQPQSVTVEEGEMARVQFTAEGEGLTYTWYFKDAGDTAFRKTATFTGAYYSAKMTSDRDGRQLYCVVTDENGNKATTDTVTINMGTVAKIVTQPQSVTVANGSVAKVSLAAEGDGITYTWYYKNGAGASFAVTNSFKGDTYKTTMNPERAGRQVYCVITDKYGNSVTSDVVTLNMTGAVQITKQPGTVIVPDGQSFSIKVSAKGEGLTYAWYYKDKGSDTFKLTTTFKGSSYSSTMTAARDGRQVYCVITDEYGCSVRTNTVSMIMGVPVSVVRQPSSVVVPSGEKFTVSVKAIGDELTYTWYFRNKGASSFSKTDSFKGAEYYATMTDARDGRQVYCVITDKYGNSVTTDTVTLTMGNPATIVKQPSSVVVLEGETANVTLEATGDGLTYAWYYKNKNGTSFLLTTSFTGSSYRVTMTPERDGRQVYCVITDKYGSSVTTDTVTLIMGQPVSIVKQPASAVVMLGHKASVSVDAAGVELTYQWYFKNPGGTKFHKSSVTTDTYTVKMADSVNGRQVYCVITDKYGNSVKTETVTIKLGATIITQPQSVTVADGSTAKVSVEAEGDGIKYQWYFKNPGGTKFHKSSVTTDTYTVKMSASADERQVYCVITDSAGNTVTTDIVTIYMAHSYGEGVVENEVSCTKDGITVYTCSDCGKVKTVVTPATGHAMGDWQVHREPTPENEGVERSSCANCSYYNDRSIEKIKAVYHIIVDLGNGETYSVGVGANGVYTLATPVKIGYNFLGWKDSAGNAFEGSGTVSENCIVSAVWELDGTDTLEKLIKRAEAGVDKIVITADIIVNKPIFISYNTTIYSDEDHTLLRAPNYAGDIFVVGQDKYGTDSILYHRVGVLTLGGGKGVLTIDGNRDNLTVTVVGSAVYVADSGILNLHNGTRIVNNLKLGNDRVLRNTDYVSVYTVERAGGAAILSLNATVNMYGGVIDNNEVYTEYTIVTNEDGTESWLTNYACGGAVYSRGGFNMYGGVISNSRALQVGS